MASKTLMMAMDFSKRKGVQHGRRYYRKGDDYYLVEFGPKYENHFKLSELSPAEVAFVEASIKGEDGK